MSNVDRQTCMYVTDSSAE